LRIGCGPATGHPLTPRRLATLLEGFRVNAKQIRQGAATRKAYLRSDFTDAFRHIELGCALQENEARS
jgi:hypothetical protein